MPTKVKKKVVKAKKKKVASKCEQCSCRMAKFKCECGAVLCKSCSNDGFDCPWDDQIIHDVSPL